MISCWSLACFNIRHAMGIRQCESCCQSLVTSQHPLHQIFLNWAQSWRLMRSRFKRTSTTVRDKGHEQDEKIRVHLHIISCIFTLRSPIIILLLPKAAASLKIFLSQSLACSDARYAMGMRGCELCCQCMVTSQPPLFQNSPNYAHS